MKILLLLLILLGLLAALVFGILWIISLFTYINHQPARLIRNAFIAMAIVILSTMGLGVVSSEGTESAQQRLAAEKAELKVQLKELQGELGELTAENEKLQSEKGEMEAENEALRQEHDELQTEVIKYAAAAEQVAASKTILVNEKEALLTEVTALKQQLEATEFKMGSLLEEVASLETALALSDETATGSASIPGIGATAALAESSSSGNLEDFSNCTELKTVYPGGVASDHDAYQSAMDRDQDGWACE